METATLKLADFLHYERNDPAKKQSVYFNVDEDFAEHVRTIIQTEFNAFPEDMDMGEALCRWRDQISAELGPFSLDQLIFITHEISLHVNHMTGYGEGFLQGLKEKPTIQIDVASMLNAVQRSRKPNAEA